MTSIDNLADEIMKGLTEYADLHTDRQSIFRVPYRFLLMQTARQKISMPIMVYITLSIIMQDIQVTWKLPLLQQNLQPKFSVKFLITTAFLLKEMTVNFHSLLLCLSSLVTSTTSDTLCTAALLHVLPQNLQLPKKARRLRLKN